jgi:hypothetical protein
MTIYVVTSTEYGIDRVCGVFSTQRKAEDYVVAYMEYNDIDIEINGDEYGMLDVEIGMRIAECDLDREVFTPDDSN